MTTKYKSDRYSDVTPYLIAADAAGVIEFLKATFGSTEVEMMKGDAGQIMHAEIRVGDSIIMLSQASQQFPAMPVMLYVYVKDCDAAYKKAIAAGGISTREPANQFYGDRSCAVKDHSGNLWCIATHVEDVSSEEMMRRMKAGKPS
jgi:PhnB protein